MNQNERLDKLPNAPLKEVIFDVRWGLDLDEESNKMYDSKFELALGKFHSEIMKLGFNNSLRIVPPFMPKDILNHIPQFRFSKVDAQYPIIQIGEGVLSVNETDENYLWSKNFYPLIKDTLNTLYKSYDNQLDINTVTLRYIDAVDIKDLEKDDYLDFLGHNLNYNVQKTFELEGELQAFNFSEKIKRDDGIILSLNFSTANDVKTGNPQLLWQYIATIEKKLKKEDVLEWVEHAHGVLSNLFCNMLNRNFYESFKEQSDL